MKPSRRSTVFVLASVGIIAALAIYRHMRPPSDLRIAPGHSRVEAARAQSPTNALQAAQPHLLKPRARADDRHPAAQDSDSNRAYEKSDDLLALLDDLAGAIDRGDATALGIQARALEECSILVAAPQYFDNFEARSDIHGDKKALALGYVQRYAKRCDNLARGRHATRKEISEAASAAATAGNPWGDAHRFRRDSRNMDANPARDELGAIIASRDPEAIGELAEMMGLDQVDASGEQKYGPLAGSQLDGDAWQLASCDLGRDCSNQGKLMRQMCIFGGTCSSGNFREMLKQSMSPDDFAKVEQIEQQVLDRIMSGTP